MVGLAARWRSCLGGLLIAVLACTMGAPPAMALTAEEVTAQIEARFPVKVLRVRESAEYGEPAYAVTVMNVGGNFNEAFQVNTIMVDRRTGELLPQFRHLPAGQDDRAGLASRRWPENAAGGVGDESAK